MKILQLVFSAIALSAFTAAHAEIPKTIRFGIDPTYPPFETKKTDGSITGFDVDLGNAICTELKRKCVWVESAFDGLIPALKAKKFDAILSGMSMTEQRMQEINFSNRLFRSPARLIAKSGSNIKPTPESLKGKSIGVLQGSTEEVYAKTYWATKGANVQPYENQDQAYNDLVAGRLDATLQEAATAVEGFLNKPQGKGYAFTGSMLKDDKIFGTGSGIGLRKEDKELQLAINSALAKMKSNGTYNKIMKKYFDYDISGDK
ncbi:ABC transporter substrate-binding protein [Leeia sp. TBRC 13508]|uniref:ABC transporter substrate-binding protein n=1 Tax=Leeia speluncae TaxID=2884804 RepID=A0ABS8D757_9NEIS|nr:ABC transporter substrate-binding protein [Leeia speluncae]MCB6184012.1 ABC transporter substrate-binding protein [Leeia speluncae]